MNVASLSPLRWVLLGFLSWTVGGAVHGAEALRVERVTGDPGVSRFEFRLEGVPGVGNPFDPEQVRVDAVFTAPSGRRFAIPGFWFQDFERRLDEGRERLSERGAPSWRIRFTALEAGRHQLRVTVSSHSRPALELEDRLMVAEGEVHRGTGFARVGRGGRGGRYFETLSGEALPLRGANVCWPGARGTFDYDDWFPAMERAGFNFVRLWMCPWAFGIEAEPGTLNRYRLDRAWALDRVMREAEGRGMHVLLALDFHGMFEVTKDVFGGNDFWPENPYNAALGGPSATQTAFFSGAESRTIYQKRLRYLVGRYGAVPGLFGWEFFNEIDNVKRHLDMGAVVLWHGVMGQWLRENDPYRHLISTSLVGSSDRPELWQLPQLDFTAYHSYNESNPAMRLGAVATSFLERYGKPVMIGEFGIDFRGWNRGQDPFLRGLRQGIWGGALGGSAGMGMSWWWENLHSENVYPLYQAFGKVMAGTRWGRGVWHPIRFQTAGEPPVELGMRVEGGAEFGVVLRPGTGWGDKPRGELALPHPEAGRAAATQLNGFVHGTAHPELRVPFRVRGWFGSNAAAVVRVKSVSGGATLSVLVDGTESFRTNLVDRDGLSVVNTEYDVDFRVPVAAGKRVVEILNAGRDWLFVESVTFEKLTTATYDRGWEASPAAVGLRGERESLLYVVAPAVVFPAGATVAEPPRIEGRELVLTDWPAGEFEAAWFDAATGGSAGSTTGRSDSGVLRLRLPGFREDLAGVLVPRQGGR